MGGEELYKVSLMPADATEGKNEQATWEAAGDVADPFEMMGGMGGEELYKVTLMPDEPQSGKPEPQDPALEARRRESITKIQSLARGMLTRSAVDLKDDSKNRKKKKA